MKYRNIEILEKANECILTNGLNKIIGYEIQLKTSVDKNGDFNLIFFLVNYFIDSKPVIKDNETISYGLWLLKFCLKNGFFIIYELDELFINWSEGATNAVYYFELQKETCKKEAAEFSVPMFIQKIAISKGVLEGRNVQGIRYNEPKHMSGWYITTDEYNNDIKNLQVIELQNLVVKRSDLLQFLALPPGFIFETFDNNECYIWRVPDVTENLG